MSIETVADIQQVTVIGAGEMGRGIAAVAALAGYDTILQDIDEDQLNDAIEQVKWSYGKIVDDEDVTEADVEAALDRITSTTSLEEAVANTDIVTEAAVEKQAVKEDIFESVDNLAPDEAILTTNTSGLNITRLAEVTDRPSQVAGTHWFNPPMLMDLVEIIETEHVDSQVVDVVEDLIKDFEKTPIRCRRDVPMFIVNRCMRPYGEAAAWLVYYDKAEIEEVDSAMKYREGFPMGPFELADFTGGIQVRVESEEDHLNDPRPLNYDTRYCPLLHERYEKGHYGRKSGKGFYDYSDQDEPGIDPEAGKDVDVLKIWAPVINEAAKMVQHDVATVEDVDTGMKLGGNWPVGPFEKADEVGAETVVRTCVELANMHERVENLAETLPCDLLVEKAKGDETFY
ncbi:3-hydroxyacyl-CoA dehydrogenase [Natronomonas gomsonensis]|uniref:3-hydroxyacyl-CoA dehydrogenase n=1 Tax=Natronomonas gomsonensis TaxID=1046043 RepID=UPI0020CA86C3|nr:3-hydroxyacyl-CoA dehydrogenase [Natronomonas gomsonensis]MCY4729913.1 3-hydroxyacyl-CoA dehydrogenase [Natronomonas gomsonensis]